MNFVTIYHAPVDLTFKDLNYASAMADGVVIATVDGNATNVYGTRRDAMAVAVALGLEIEEIAE